MSPRLRRCPRPFSVRSFLLFAAGAALLAAGSAAPLGAQGLLSGTDQAPGAPAHLKQFDGTTFALERSFFPYGPAYTGGVRVASGDVNDDGIDDLVTGSGTGSSHVKVFSGVDNAELRSFLAFDPAFTGGVYVAAGDVDGDGFADVVVGADSGGAPHVKVFSGASGAEIRSFFAYAPGFTGGVRVAAADHDNDGLADIVTGAGAGGAPHVKVFRGTDLAELRSFFAYTPSFTGGVFVAAADFNGDGFAELVSGPGSGSSPEVKVFNGADIAVIGDFMAFAPSFTGGVRVAAGDIDGTPGADLAAGSGPGAAHLAAWSGPGTAPIASFFAYPLPYDDGIFVATTSAPEGGIEPPPSVLAVPALGTAGLIALATLLAALAALRLRRAPAPARRE